MEAQRRVTLQSLGASTKQGLEERVWYPLKCLHSGLLQSILQVPELIPRFEPSRQI